jgi:hypothetical protein
VYNNNNNNNTREVEIRKKKTFEISQRKNSCVWFNCRVGLDTVTRNGIKRTSQFIFSTSMYCDLNNIMVIRKIRTASGVCVCLANNFRKKKIIISNNDTNWILEIIRIKKKKQKNKSKWI